MSILTSFDQCIARPDDNDAKFYLSEHLLKVRYAMEQWLDKTDSMEHDDVLIKLMGLAGICHDMAKANVDWQIYICNPHQRKGPTHALAGAFLFSYIGYHLLKNMNAWETYKVYWLWLIRDIADHHGVLKNIDEMNWIGEGEWNKADFGNIVTFIKHQYPQVEGLDLSEESLGKWIRTVYRIIEEVKNSIDMSYEKQSPTQCVQWMERLQIWRHLTTGLISGDRFDVSSIETSWFDRQKYRECDKHMDAYCRTKSGHPLSFVRFAAQQDILQQLKSNPDESIYTLEMPTGYGKTITALKVATWLGQQRQYRKIVYVAPYLSILEQTSKVIEEAMNISALEHHSLAILDDDRLENRVPKSQLAMESWAHLIICTSFQQWSKAIFPRRAQDVLRRSFIQDSVIIIDEPQIFKPEVWNVFLYGLGAMIKQYNLRVIFLSATMPPFEYGLTKEPVCLAVKATANLERYRVIQHDSMDERQLTDFLIEREEKVQGAILNTIEDAFLVYKRLIDLKEPATIVHGLMIPLHKRVEISKIQHHLKYHRDIPLYVVSTQVLEAGVDVSFQHVVRALSILPSIVQAAGRVNRHFEEAQGTVSIVPFMRGGTQNTRNIIYKNADLRNITDHLLKDKEIWVESEMIPLIQRYYKEMFRMNTYEAGLKDIAKAYEGEWTRLGDFQPFGEDYFKLPLFIPWNINVEDQVYLPPQYVHLREKVGVSTPEDIYDLYRDRIYMNKFSFEERKQFMILFNHFVLNIPVKVALKVANKDDYLDHKIPILYGMDAYDQNSGFIQHFGDTSNVI